MEKVQPGCCSWASGSPLGQGLSTLSLMICTWVNLMLASCPVAPKECLAESQLLPMRWHPYSHPSCDNPKHLHTLPVSRWSSTIPNWILIEPHRMFQLQGWESRLSNHHEVVQFMNGDKKSRNFVIVFQLHTWMTQLTLGARTTPWPHPRAWEK